MDQPSVTSTPQPSLVADATARTYDVGTPDEWTEHILPVATVTGFEATAEALDGAEPTKVGVEWHIAAKPDGLMPPSVRLDIETDCFSTHYCSGAAAREMAAALLLAADRLDRITSEAGMSGAGLPLSAPGVAVVDVPGLDVEVCYVPDRHVALFRASLPERARQEACHWLSGVLDEFPTTTHKGAR